MRWTRLCICWLCTMANKLLFVFLLRMLCGAKDLVIFQWIGAEFTPNINTRVSHLTDVSCIVCMDHYFFFFRDQVHPVAIIRHVLDQISDTVLFLNPGQVPVIVAIEPIYAVTKQVQGTGLTITVKTSLSLCFEACTLRWLHWGQLEFYCRKVVVERVLCRWAMHLSEQQNQIITAFSNRRTWRCIRRQHLLSTSMTQMTDWVLQWHRWQTEYFNDTDDNNGEKEQLGFEGWCESFKLRIPKFQFWNFVVSGTGDPPTNPIIHGSQLQPVLSVTGWVGTIFFYAQQCKPRMMTSHTPQRHGNTETETPSISHGF